MYLLGSENIENVYGRQTLAYCNSTFNPLYIQPYLTQLTSKILTSSSLITLTHLRPIDHLVMILDVDSRHFDDFVEKFTLLESCTMLL